MESLRLFIMDLKRYWFVILCSIILLFSTYFAFIIVVSELSFNQQMTNHSLIQFKVYPTRYEIRMSRDEISQWVDLMDENVLMHYKSSYFTNKYNAPVIYVFGNASLIGLPQSNQVKGYAINAQIPEPFDLIPGMTVTFQTYAHDQAHRLVPNIEADEYYVITFPKQEQEVLMGEMMVDNVYVQLAQNTWVNSTKKEKIEEVHAFYDGIDGFGVAPIENIQIEGDQIAYNYIYFNWIPFFVCLLGLFVLTLWILMQGMMRELTREFAIRRLHGASLVQLALRNILLYLVIFGIGALAIWMYMGNYLIYKGLLFPMLISTILVFTLYSLSVFYKIQRLHLLQLIRGEKA